MRRALLLATLVALAAPAASLAAERQVGIHGNVFDPRRINVVVGDSVRWSNHTFVNHNLHTASGAFPDKTLNPNESWPTPAPFNSVTTVEYLCTIHANMQGTIAVWDLWLADPAIATAGGTANLKGLAQDVDVEITAKKWNDADDTWEALALQPAKSGSNGAYTRPVPAVPGLYKTSYGTHESRQVRLSVKPKLAITKRRIKRGLWSVTVKATPNQAGATAVVDRKKTVGWAKIASKSFGALSKATFKVSVPNAQRRIRIRLIHAKNGYSPATSPTLTLKR